MILYFSATGNCKYTALRIAEAVGERAFSIIDKNLPDEPVLGIVIPTYAFGLPEVVEDYLRKCRITKKDNYLFLLATYGTTVGQIAYFADKALKSGSGITFDAFYSVKMPDSWTPMFDLSDKAKVEAINKAADEEITEVIELIKAKNKGNRMKKQTPIITRLFYRPYYDSMRRTQKFAVEDSCIGCGLCAKICPIGAIEMIDKRPSWRQKRCTMCLGCLHHCPKFAIQYGKNTKKHGQYQHPNVNL